MSVVVQCLNCSAQFSAPDEVRGQRLPCPTCGAPINIPNTPPPTRTDPSNLGHRNVGPRPTGVAALLDEESRRKPSGAESAKGFDKGTIAALGISERKLYTGRNKLPSDADQFPAGRRGGALGVLLPNVLFFLVITASIGSFVIFINVDRSMQAAITAMVGLLIAAGGWRSQSLAGSNRKVADDWRIIEGWIGVVVLALLALWCTFGAGYWFYRVLFETLPAIGMNEYIGKGMAFVAVAWLITIGYCLMMLKWSHTHGFFKPAGWSYFVFFVLILGLSAIGRLAAIGAGAPIPVHPAPALGANGPMQNGVASNPDHFNRPVSASPRIISSSRVAGAKNFEARISVPPDQPGKANRLFVYIPPGEHANGSLGCVMINAAGATLMCGMKLADSDRTEHFPYVAGGFAVVAYETDGAMPDDHASQSVPVKNEQSRKSYQDFAAAEAGLVNAHHAIDWALNNIPEVDPHKIYAAGHSSAATLALLLAENDSRIKACVAYAPCTDVEARVKPQIQRPEAFPGMLDFLHRTSPRTHEANLNCPVFLFHAEDDSNISIQETKGFADRLKALGKTVTLVTVPQGNHYNSMIRAGIPAAIEWLCKLEGRAVPVRDLSVESRPARDPRPAGAAPRPTGAVPNNGDDPNRPTFDVSKLQPGDKLEFSPSGQDWKTAEYVGPGPTPTTLLMKRPPFDRPVPTPIGWLRLPTGNSENSAKVDPATDNPFATNKEKSPPVQSRSWSDAAGKFKIEATIVRVESGNVILRRTDGNEIRVPLEKLGDADKNYVADFQSGKFSPAP